MSLAKFVSDQKARYKWLDGGIHFIAEIPKNPSVSIRRIGLWGAELTP